MAFLSMRFTSLVAGVVTCGFALTGCSGSISSDGDSGSGGSENGGSGSGTVECVVDNDCVAASHTDGDCYSQGCSLPEAASTKELLFDSCLVEWEGTSAPAASDECRASSGNTVCPLLCAAPPTCILPYCDAGSCALVVQQDGSACTRPAAGSGGSGSGGSTASDCVSLEQKRDETLQAARSCLVDGFAPECQLGQTIKDECGCPVVVNDNQAERVQAAQEAYSAWNAACEPPEKCQLVDCANGSGSTGCQATLGGSEGVCAWQ